MYFRPVLEIRLLLVYRYFASRAFLCFYKIRSIVFRLQIKYEFHGVRGRPNEILSHEDAAKKPQIYWNALTKARYTLAMVCKYSASVTMFAENGTNYYKFLYRYSNRLHS